MGLKIWILLWGAMLIQGYFFAGGYGPQLNLIIIAVLAHRKGMGSLYLAIWAGFWLDVFSGAAFGFYMAFLLLVCLAIIWLKNRGADLNGRVALLLTVCLLVIAQALAQWAITWITTSQLIINDRLVWLTLIQVIATILTTVIIYRPLNSFIEVTDA